MLFAIECSTTKSKERAVQPLHVANLKYGAKED
jgi:hypothetical protein